MEGAQNQREKLMIKDMRMSRGSDDRDMMKQILASHSPDGRHFNVKPIIHVVEAILRRANSSIYHVLNGTQSEAVENLEDTSSPAGPDDNIEYLAYSIHTVACEMSCKCSGGGDAHSTTLAVLESLKSYAWDAKVVISLAAFSVNYGEFHLVIQLLSVNPLAKSVAILKQLPDIIEQANSLKPQLDALNKLITAVVEMTKSMVDLKDLPSHYIGADTPAMSLALAHIPMAVYWAIRSIVVSATLIARNEYSDSTSQAWELSSLTHKADNIHGLLKQQLAICYQILVRLFETHQLDNMKILKSLIYPNDDQQPLFHGATKTKVHVEVLKRKHVLLLISDMRISNEEVMVLAHMYTEAQDTSEFHYEIVWLPVVGGENWQEADERKFMELQSIMPWYSIIHPSLMQPAAVRYVKEMWHFSKRTILVPLDPAGKVMSTNAFNMLWIWGNLAFPFTMEREETLWRAEDWTLQLLRQRKGN